MNRKRFDVPAGEIIRMRVSYDGREFVGSQRQADARTVQGELERAIQEIAGKAIPIHLAGRTDRGVHAAGQVVSFSREGVRLGVAQLPKAMKFSRKAMAYSKRANPNRSTRIRSSPSVRPPKPSLLRLSAC